MYISILSSSQNNSIDLFFFFATLEISSFVEVHIGTKILSYAQSSSLIGHASFDPFMLRLAPSCR